MSRLTRKIILTAVISVLGILASIGWYEWDRRKNSSGSQGNLKVIARLSESKNDIQKRQAKKVIWQSVEPPEELHVGDGIRTSSIPGSEAKIKFAESGAELSLEEDSVVVIEDVGNKLSVDFVKGNVLVKGGESSSLAVKSGDTQIALNNGELSLAKQSGKKLDVQVLKGKVEISAEGGKQELDAAKLFFKIVAPEAGEKVFVRTDKQDSVAFKWTPLTGEYLVQVEAGPNRTQLKPNDNKVDGTKGELTTPMKPGTYYWRLTATNQKDPKQIFYSVVSKLIVVGEQPPQLISPLKDEQVVLNGDEMAVTFRWSLSNLEKPQIQVAKDSQFKDSLIPNGSVFSDTDFYKLPVEKEGTYFWRVIATRPNSQIRLVSPTYKFSILTQFALKPPKLKAPDDKTIASFDSVSANGQLLTWNPVPGMAKYSVKFSSKTEKESKTLFEKEVKEVSHFRTGPLTHGLYEWSVASVDKSGKKSEYSPPWTLEVEQVPELKWADGSSSSNYSYATAKPTISVQWLAVQGPAATRIKNYRITLKDNEDVELKKLVQTKLEFTADVPVDGKYKVQVEALTDKEFILARTVEKLVDVSLKQLLPPPEFDSRMPASFTASKDGGFSVQWLPVKDAKFYTVYVKDDKGQVAKKERVAVTNKDFQWLLPGTYKISLATVDQWGREGQPGKERNIEVPQVSSSKAPGLKKFKLK